MKHGLHCPGSPRKMNYESFIGSNGIKIWYPINIFTADERIALCLHEQVSLDNFIASVQAFEHSACDVDLYLDFLACCYGIVGPI